MAEQVKLEPEELDLLQKVDEAIIRAGEIMDLADQDAEGDPDGYDEVFEARFHCGKCIVSTVMETIWEDLNNLLEYYSNRPPQESETL